jgi:tetratricopeptide (TPR) repeat protein
LALSDYIGWRKGGALVIGTFLGAAALSVSSSALAQDDAADKANARSLATEGIELYNEGRYADALDRLERAQSLFDAPMHLLYIARAQVKLGQLVEASETYRRLIRVELSQETPAAVREAVEAADAELDGVEARVSALRIEIVPPNEPGLVVTIDDKPVSPAAIGVDRPMNPGRHRIRASVSDGRRVETTIELADGAREALRLELAMTPPSSPAAAVTQPGDAAPSRGFVLFAGAGLGAGLPVGKLSTGPDAPMSDYAGFGASLELKLGVRFARYFGAKLFGEGALHAPGSPPVNLSRLAGGASSGDRAKPAVVNRQAFGLSFLAGSPHGKLGGYGELGVAYERLAVDLDISLREGECGTSTSQSLVATGPSLRVGGGAFVPISRSFQLVPFAHGTIGRYRHATTSSCEWIPPPAYLAGDIDGDRVATHAWIVAGLSGEFSLFSR